MEPVPLLYRALAAMRMYRPVSRLTTCKQEKVLHGHGEARRDLNPSVIVPPPTAVPMIANGF
ncbi:hypothetical protein J6590_092786 [Homalodisca vitripennis]|nr:hypothetical protein J6590_092786 [Homalodisca vitripennis]